jgi:hypothetical protein
VTVSTGGGEEDSRAEVSEGGSGKGNVTFRIIQRDSGEPNVSYNRQR